jgi:FKBP-type peptidyl-prolyl cis-trans isomerase FkpA
MGIPLASNGFLTQFCTVQITHHFRTARMKRIALHLLPCILLGACLTSPKDCEANPSNPATETFATSLGVDLNAMQKTALGDYTQDLVVGTGDVLTTPQIVTIHYSAYLTNGTLIDQVIDQPFPIDLVNRATIGLTDGMMGMNVGGKRRIVVPSALGLGACPNGPIPGNSTLIYEVELLSITG